MGIWLSYSAYRQYKTCPQQYQWDRVIEKEPSTPPSQHNAIVGSVVQEVYEDFYNDELWRRGSETSDELLRRTEEYYWDFIDERHVDFDDITCRFDSPHEPLEECKEIIPKALQGIKHKKLLGPYAKSEVEIKVRFESTDFLIGHLDFIIRKQDDTVMILDGKSSRHREEYVDEEQLYFYALIFYIRYRKLPDKLGFFYYRYADDPEQAIDWIPVDKKRIKELREDIKQVITDIRKKKFKATPKHKHCQWCPYNDICDARQDQKKKNRAKRRMNSDKASIDADFDDSGRAEIGFDNLDDD